MHCCSHCNFKYHHNAPFTVLVFIFLQLQIVSNTIRNHHLSSLFFKFICSSKSFLIPSECKIHRPCFQNCLCSSNSFQIPPECTSHRPCFKFFFSAVQYCFKYRQNAPFTFLVYILFPAVLNRFKYRQNAPFTTLLYILFSALLNRFKYCLNV